MAFALRASLTTRPVAGARRAATVAAPAGGLPALPARPARSSVAARAKNGEVDVDAIVKDLQTKWDGVENKTSVIVYGAGAVVALWLASSVVSAVNAVPLLPKLLELVGLGYTAWFTYRYLLFKSAREELLADVQELKKKITE